MEHKKLKKQKQDLIDANDYCLCFDHEHYKMAEYHFTICKVECKCNRCMKDRTTKTSLIPTVQINTKLSHAQSDDNKSNIIAFRPRSK